MKTAQRASVVAGVLVVAALVGCSGTDALPGMFGGNSSAQDGSQSVGDVVNSLDGGGVGQPLPAGTTAKVRNESDRSADVTVRFVQGDTIVHLAFVRVTPETETSVASLEAADSIQVSGVDEQGSALASATLTFGADFDYTLPAVYTIRPADGADPTDPQEGPSAPGSSENPGAETPDAATYERPTIALLEPTDDLRLVLGSTLTVKWEDTSSVSGTVVWLGLRAVNGNTAGDFIPLGPAVGAALDGLNDELLVVVQDVEVGNYEVVARIDDGVQVVSVTSPGIVEVSSDSDNAAPRITLEAPVSLMRLGSLDLLRIAWDDSDPDDNATVWFSLVPTDPDASLGGSFEIGPPVAEDPDGGNRDMGYWWLEDVLPGLYDLVATIDDGDLAGTSRVSGVIRIVPEEDNDAPILVLEEPAEDLDIPLEGSFLVQWSDSDTNDNARVSLMLDPMLSPSGGAADEILLVSSLGEDEDADRITLGVPDDTPVGAYRVKGVITDGQIEASTYAPGLLFIGEGAKALWAGGGLVPGDDRDPPPPPPPPEDPKDDGSLRSPPDDETETDGVDPNEGPSDVPVDPGVELEPGNKPDIDP